MPVLRKTCELFELFPIIKELGGFIAGGYARWCASPNPGLIPKDMDIFVPSEGVEDDILSALNELDYQMYFDNKSTYNFCLPEYSAAVRSMDYGVIFGEEFRNSFKVQVIKWKEELDFTSLEKLLDHFDFSIIRCGFLDDNTILADPDFWKDETMKFLRIKHIHCPVGTMIRAMKYKVKGYTFEPVDIVKLMEFWEKDMDAKKKEEVRKLINEIGKEPHKMADLYHLMMLD